MKSFKKFGLGVGVGLLIGVATLLIWNSRLIYLSDNQSVALGLGILVVIALDIYLLLRKRVALSIGVIVGFILPWIFLVLLLTMGCLSSGVCA
jgi:hypothetical protein